MSYAQQQIIEMAPQLSDSAANAVLYIINTFIVLENKTEKPIVSEKKKAYLRMKQMVGGFPKDFDPYQEIAEAKKEKYGTFD